jgi:hypothetical protein
MSTNLQLPQQEPALHAAAASKPADVRPHQTNGMANNIQRRGANNDPPFVGQRDLPWQPTMMDQSCWLAPGEWPSATTGS